MSGPSTSVSLRHLLSQVAEHLIKPVGFVFSRGGKIFEGIFFLVLPKMLDNGKLWLKK